MVKLQTIHNNVKYGFNNGHSYWIKPDNGKFLCYIWKILPTPENKPIKEIAVDTLKKAEKWISDNEV